MPSVDVDGARIAYETRGSGDPLVLVHGSASDYRTWEAQQEAFAENHRVVAYSRRYHWPNDPIPDGRDYSMAQHVDDLEALVRSLEAAPAYLVGHSYGAILCLLLAMREPRLVRRLVLAEPPIITLFVSASPRPYEIAKLALRRPRTAASVARFGARGVVPAGRAFRRGDPQAGIRVFGDAVFGAGGYDGLPESRRAQAQDNLSNVAAELLGSGHLPVDPDLVRRVRVPTLLITGERSIGLFRHLIDRLEELLPHVHRMQIPQASHMMHEDNAPAFNTAVLSFFSRRHQTT